MATERAMGGSRPDRPVVVSFTQQEANELAIAAEAGVSCAKIYVDKPGVQTSVARLRQAVEQTP